LDEFGEKHEGSKGVNLETHFEKVVKEVSTCTWRVESCKLGGGDQVNWAINVQVIIGPVRFCTVEEVI